MMDITVAIVGASGKMSNLVMPLISVYLVVALTSAPFIMLNEKNYGDSNWIRYCIFWPAYVLHWIIRNAILAVRGL